MRRKGGQGGGVSEVIHNLIHKVTITLDKITILNEC